MDITAVDETRQDVTLGYLGVFSHDLAASRDHVNAPIAVLLQNMPAHRIVRTCYCCVRMLYLFKHLQLLFTHLPWNQAVYFDAGQDEPVVVTGQRFGDDVIETLLELIHL